MIGCQLRRTMVAQTHSNPRPFGHESGALTTELYPKENSFFYFIFHLEMSSTGTANCERFSRSQEGSGQSQAGITASCEGSGRSQVGINTNCERSGQSLVGINTNYERSGQSLVGISTNCERSGQSQVGISTNCERSVSP